MGVVDIAANGVEAVHQARTGPHERILMDNRMPEMDGTRAAQETRALGRTQQRLAGVPIVAMNAHDMAGARGKSLDAGMQDHVTKPIAPVELPATLTRWLKRSAASGPSVSQGEVSVEAPRADRVPELPGFDTSAALARVGGNLPLYLRLLCRLRDDYSGAVDEVDAALAAGTHEQALFVVHKVQGVAGNLGAVDLYREAAGLHAALKADADGALLASALGSFRRAFDAAMCALADVGEPDGLRPTLAASAEVSVASLPDMLGALARLDSELRFPRPGGCRSALDEMEEMTWPLDLREDLSRLGRMVRGYDFDNARLLVAKMRQTVHSERP